MNEVKTEVKSEHGGACVCTGCKPGSKASFMHYYCCVAPIVSIIFWKLGILCLILAWVAGDGQIWGKADAFWYLNAITLGVLAMGGRKKWGACRKGGCSSGTCSTDGSCCGNGTCCK